LLLGLLIVNLAVYWPRTKGSDELYGHPPWQGGEGAPGARLEAALASLPEADRKKVQEHVAAERAFFASIKDLAEDDRRQKMQEYFSKNPPPEVPGMGRPAFVPVGDAPPLPTVGQAGRSSSGPTEPSGNMPRLNRLPEPLERREMDQQFVNSRKNRQTQP